MKRKAALTQFVLILAILGTAHEIMTTAQDGFNMRHQQVIQIDVCRVVDLEHLTQTDIVPLVDFKDICRSTLI